MSILQYGCTTWTIIKHIDKKLGDNYTRMLRAILNKSWRQQPTKQQLYGHLPPITKIIQVRRTRHARHCWRSRDELIIDIIPWTSSHGQANAGRPARTYIQQLCQKRWTIEKGGERGSGRSVLITRYNDDYDDLITYCIITWVTNHYFPLSVDKSWLFYCPYPFFLNVILTWGVKNGRYLCTRLTCAKNYTRIP